MTASLLTARRRWVLPACAALLLTLGGCRKGAMELAPPPPAPPPVGPPSVVPVTKINPIDGAAMVLIPAGPFLMGTSEEQLAAWMKDHPTDTREGFADEMPQRTVDLDAYYLYTTEVTVTQYRKFCAATDRAMPSEPEWTHPIVGVTWEDAKAYADWAGAALPTEAQWEKAARGGDGRLYPWGNAWPPPAKAGNLADESLKRKHPTSGIIEGYDDGYAGTAPAGSFAPNPYGVHDLAGNVCEWCADWYAADAYQTGAAKSPTGPETGRWRVVRGGSWYAYTPRHLRVARRYYRPPGPVNAIVGIGFRCAVRSPGRTFP